MSPGETPDANRLTPVDQDSLEDSDLPEKCSRLPLHLICFSLLFFLPAMLVAAPLLDSNLAISSEGYFVLSWEPADTSTGLRLQLSDNPEFSGQPEEWPVTGATQFTQSGLFNGDYYFRLVDSAGVSNTVQVTVRHHSLARAFLFFGLGATLFAILLVSLLLGRAQHRKEAAR